jgi:hypothetical protein
MPFDRYVWIWFAAITAAAIAFLLFIDAFWIHSGLATVKRKGFWTEGKRPSTRAIFTTNGVRFGVRFAA